jgi:CheY-like chemotaxis protein
VSPKRILFVEPDYALGCMAQRALRPEEVFVAPTFASALALLERVHMDAVVFDPEEESGGFDFLVRLATELPSLRIVVYTLSAEAERRTAFGTAHVIIRKPATADRLREAILSAVDSGEYRAIRGR